ncbi:hypothetical protein GcM3_179013 [Golovinomyces cichoracearum]|uniref:Uncharacterized protein n=1 Tax=Golovinomyces cichoracearum TaxID=62708 RepID=A0A420HNB4_9PEZI|nr:hypothetical protein GcM3_179013 [Golovinomyces cichoracearum]
MFFQSWELWERMTFILGIALFLVFTFGWVKLAIKVRLMKKHEIVDEEKRSRIQEFRGNSQRGESRGKHEIPFGVRAIQSGIQVDGIWISNPNTPFPSQVTLNSLPAEDSDDPKKKAQNSTEKITIPQPRPCLRVRAPCRPESFGYRVSPERLQDIVEGRATCISYQPRRSSHLRYGDKRDSSEETREKFLEVTPLRKKPSNPQSRKKTSPELDLDSSAADNERNSGTSDESDTTLSQEPQVERDQVKINDSKEIPDDNTEKTLLSEYTLLLEKPLEVKQDTDHENVTSFDEKLEAVYSSISQPRDQSKSPPPFTPGELHMNNSSRKVNPGFEVLPAGTFGAPVEFKIDLIDPRENDLTEKKAIAKLQKKPPTSVSNPNNMTGSIS